MRLIKSGKTVNSVLKGLIKSGKRIGFVPTMGALHEGHISLIKKARCENDIVVVSIFINPKQFCIDEDYDKYPKDISGDKIKAETAGCDILFCPDKGSLYKKDFSTYVEVQGLSEGLCGASRPGHFKGVATICIKLFNIVMPDTAYFGQKDYQQALIIKKMTEDLNMNLDIKVLPVVREPSGIAMSSRNARLNFQQKQKAGLIYQSLISAKRMVYSGERNANRIMRHMRKILSVPGISIDYVSITDPASLKALQKINKQALIAVAIKIGGTRLIDNILVKPKTS
jgi:pantoate--beta-alanine ligase